MTTETYLRFPEHDKASYFTVTHCQSDCLFDPNDTAKITLYTFSELIDFMEEFEPDNTEIRYEIAAMGIGDTLLKGFPQASWDGLIILRIR